ncbi:hypothetical protein CPB83DRAFT_891535 [Crepidotus variabilis]|uniref:Uncharacterized protein n=1 Tax=Crepidotus variabilis TaxID=179855 RepID=A0A9P6EKU7_9AGAR|nr:hypothetical protein CPB83DRAFT_891535 [Crepidotus variabilis]
MKPTAKLINTIDDLIRAPGESQNSSPERHEEEESEDMDVESRKVKEEIISPEVLAAVVNVERAHPTRPVRVARSEPSIGAVDEQLPNTPTLFQAAADSSGVYYVHPGDKASRTPDDKYNIGTSGWTTPAYIHGFDLEFANKEDFLFLFMFFYMRSLRGSQWFKANSGLLN